jgi:RNA polymerase primary sigma factor
MQQATSVPHPAEVCEVDAFTQEESESYAAVPSEHDLLGLYLREAARYPRLTAEQERDLSRAILENHDEQAATILTQSNLRLVVLVAKRYQAQGLTLLDLIQEGNIGLMKAVRRYDGRRGFRFSTYAVPWITQEITRAIWTMHGPMKIPARVIDAHRRERRAVQEAAANADSEAPALPAEESASPWSMHALTGDEAIQQINALPTSEDESPCHYAEQQELLRTILCALQEVSIRDQQIIVELFGLNNTTPLKLTEVATSHNLTAERVRQIKKSIFESIRRSPYAGQLASCY